MKPEQRLSRIREIIELADHRCLATDGAVGRIQQEITDAEWREIYLLTNCRKPRKLKKPQPALA